MQQNILMFQLQSMVRMTNRIFSATSVLIKALRGNKVIFYEFLISVSANEPLANAAKILATCKLYQIKLASHDSDFIIPCQQENIQLIRDQANS